MARLPIPGSDDNNWGTLLNEFLQVAHNDDGTVRGQIKTPEDFGPIGVGDNDNDTLNAFFNEETVPDADGVIVRAFRPGATYRLTQEIVVGPSTKTHFRFLLYGNGATIRWRGGRGVGSCLRFGDFANGDGNNQKKASWSRLMDFRILARVDDGGGDVGLTMDYADFSQLENVFVGGFDRQIYAQNCNSMTWQNVNLGGGNIGIGAEFGPIVGAFNWRGGKVQKCTKGIIYRGSVFMIEGIDLSFNSEVGCELNRAGAGSVRFYSEKNGPQTPTKNNTAKVVHIIDSSNIEVLGSLNCTYGAASDGTHTGWAVKIENSSNIRVRARSKLPQIAFVEADTNCRNIIVDEMAVCNDDVGVNGVPTSGPVIPGVSALRPSIIRAPGATFLYNASDTQAPASLAPADIASWAFNANVALLNETHANFERTGNAWTVRWLTNGSNAQVKSQLHNIAGGEVYRVEGRTRLLRFAEPNPALRGPNMAFLSVRGWGTASVGQEITVRQGDQWQDWYLDYTVPAGESSVTFFLSPVTNWEKYDMLIDFVRVHRIA